MRLFIVLIITILPVFAKITLSEKQIENLKTVREVALKYKDKNGETFPNTIASICMAESSGGMNLMGDPTQEKGKIYSSLGAMQIRVPTARYISSLYPKKLKVIHAMTDIQLRKKLLTDIRFSAKIATLYVIHLSNTRKSYFSAVSGYNGGTRNHKYYKRVVKWNNILKRLKINF
jgi:hypothetical protein